MSKDDDYVIIPQRRSGPRCVHAVVHHDPNGAVQMLVLDDGDTLARLDEAGRTRIVATIHRNGIDAVIDSLRSGLPTRLVDESDVEFSVTSHPRHPGFRVIEWRDHLFCRRYRRQITTVHAYNMARDLDWAIHLRDNHG